MYDVRKLLLTARHRLDEVAIGRIELVLAVGDPYDEVGCVYAGSQLLAAVYAAPDIFAARLELERFFEWAAQVDVPELARLATTIDRWSTELLAYFRTGRASSGPVEAVNGELEAVDRIARGFRNFDNYRTRMLLKTAVSWQTPVTPRIRGRAGQYDPATPAFIA